MKDHLIFDTTDAQTILDTDSVGAFVRSDDGTLITHHTLTSGEHLDVYAAMADGDGSPITSTGGALDVNIKTSEISIDVSLDGDYDVSTNPTPDSVGMIAHDRGASPDMTSQNQRPTAASPSSDNVVAANVHALDVNSFGMAWDGSAWDRLMSTSGSLNVHLDAQTVTVSDAALANVAIANAANTLDAADTAEAAVASSLANRKYLWLYNMANNTVFIGSASVSESNGFPVSPGSYLELRAGAAVSPFFVGRAGKTPEIRTMELS